MNVKHVLLVCIAYRNWQVHCEMDALFNDVGSSHWATMCTGKQWHMTVEILSQKWNISEIKNVRVVQCHMLF